MSLKIPEPCSLSLVPRSSVSDGSRGRLYCGWWRQESLLIVFDALAISGLRLVNRSGINDGQRVASCLGYIHGLTWEKVFRTGQGNKKPLGVYTASDEGISTSRDVYTGNTNFADINLANLQ
jgi:hypothetical protein